MVMFLTANVYYLFKLNFVCRANSPEWLKLIFLLKISKTYLGKGIGVSFRI